MFWILKNEADQRFIARTYIGMMLALLYRPDAGSLLTSIIELTPFDAYTIAIIFALLGAALFRSQPIYFISYFLALLPLAIFSAYLVIFVFTTPSSSPVWIVFIVMCWLRIFNNLKIAVEHREVVYGTAS